MNRFELFLAMISLRAITLKTAQGNVTGYIKSIELEDGSGHCFNVIIGNNDGTVIVFVRSPKE